MTERRRAVFFGSGAFAVPILDALAEAPSVELVAVVSAPARPVGRGGTVTPTPVQRRAEMLGLSTLTPERLRRPEPVDAIARLAPDLLVLADYGQLVPPAILALPAAGALNLHPSLLPRHRGASPIPATILAGDRETGVSLMLMDAGLDSGPIVAQIRKPLDGTETAPDLERRLSEAAADLLATSIAAFFAGALPVVHQASQGATMTRPLRRDDGRLDPSSSVRHIERMVRAYQPWPGCWFESPFGRIVVWAAKAVPPADHEAASRGSGSAAGTIAADGDGLAIDVADGRLRLLELQLAGGRRLAASELRRGRPGLVGSRVAGPSLG
ncbi:MAG: methionyl-tRNA formyltransferase [Candidatus Limnocylindrales bacterium]